MCRNGHNSPRNKHNQCLDCVRENTRKWQSKNRLHALLYSRKWRKENPEKYKDYKDRYNLIRRNASEEEKEKIRQKNRKWQKDNPDKIRTINRIRMAFKRSHVPKWANRRKIREIYKKCPNDMHVDHIIPFKGKNVCGLHVENNLQYLTKAENLSKTNHYN